MKEYNNNQKSIKIQKGKMLENKFKNNYKKSIKRKDKIKFSKKSKSKKKNLNSLENNTKRMIIWNYKIKNFKI